ncbi:hypothetical protein CWE13_02890 [Aliidiomarina shirensis]|uniref:Uncharacterized protein n=1 Tax=Aliidiomarina shirensis TaxID=1048642 RepID=A0A432WYL3_9GAMM|nr:hypothetical protein [Aliidiomarina shirensis]RUO38849.1 hypothetical protein CWE13_02890 [Aliidiomarina shirensis]
MKKAFIIICIASFILLYEDLNHFFVLLVVGGFEVEQATQTAFSNSSVDSALFIGAFRLIPFVLLISCAAYTRLFESLKGRFSLYISLLVSILVIFSGYWSITAPLYTAEQISSTSALSYIFVPIGALFLSVCAGVGSYLLFKVYERVFKRA